MLLLLVSGCGMLEKGITGSTVHWSEVPYVAESQKSSEPNSYAATGIKAAEDGQYLYLQVFGYAKPAQVPNVLVQSGERVVQAELRIDSWRITLDSDSMAAPRCVVFSPASDGTVCSEPSVRFAERKGILEMAFPIAAIATTPVHIRVEREIRLMKGGALLTTLDYPFPKHDVAVYHTPNLPFDQRVPPRILKVEASEFTSTEATLRWESSKRISSCIELAPEGKPEKPVCDIDPPRVKHDVRLKGMTPDTLYHYNVTGRDFAGNTAVAFSGTFRTAEETPESTAIRESAKGISSIPLKAPQESPATGEAPRGVPITSQSDAVWSIGRELPAGRYRISLCAWHGPDCEQFRVMAIRSSENPLQFHTVETIPAERSGKLHQFDKILKINTPFDQLVLRTDNGSAGPVTWFELFEAP